MSEIKPVAYMFDWNLEKDYVSVTQPQKLELISVVEPHNIRTVTYDDSKFKLVPVIPTPEMVHACRLHHEGHSYLPYSLYASMIYAAPEFQDKKLDLESRDYVLKFIAAVPEYKENNI